MCTQAHKHILSHTCIRRPQAGQPRGNPHVLTTSLLWSMSYVIYLLSATKQSVSPSSCHQLLYSVTSSSTRSLPPQKSRTLQSVISSHISKCDLSSLLFQVSIRFCVVFRCGQCLYSTKHMASGRVPPGIRTPKRTNMQPKLKTCTRSRRCSPPLLKRPKKIKAN